MTLCFVLVLALTANLSGCVDQIPAADVGRDRIGESSVADILSVEGCAVVVVGLIVPVERVAPLIPASHEVRTYTTSATARLRLSMLDCEDARSGPSQTGALQIVRLSVPIRAAGAEGDGTASRYLLWYADDTDDGRFRPKGAPVGDGPITLERTAPAPVTGTVTWTLRLAHGTLTTQAHGYLSDPRPFQESGKIWVDGEGPPLLLTSSGMADSSLTGLQQQSLTIIGKTPLDPLVDAPLVRADVFPMDDLGETWREDIETEGEQKS